MKKMLILLLAAFFLITGCGQKEEKPIVPVAPRRNQSSSSSSEISLPAQLEASSSTSAPSQAAPKGKNTPLTANAQGPTPPPVNASSDLFSGGTAFPFTNDAATDATAPVDVEPPSIEIVTKEGGSVQQWVADQYEGSEGVQKWAQDMYAQSNATEQWQPAIAQLKLSFETSLLPTDYAGIDYISVSRTDVDGFNATLNTGLHIFAVNQSAVDEAIAKLEPSYDQSVGKMEIITSKARYSLKTLTEIEAQIRSQPFFNAKTTTGVPVIEGFSYEKGGIVVLLNTRSTDLEEYIDKHPYGKVIGYRGTTLPVPRYTRSGMFEPDGNVSSAQSGSGISSIQP